MRDALRDSRRHLRLGDTDPQCVGKCVKMLCATGNVIARHDMDLNLIACGTLLHTSPASAKAPRLRTIACPEKGDLAGVGTQGSIAHCHPVEQSWIILAKRGKCQWLAVYLLSAQHVPH